MIEDMEDAKALMPCGHTVGRFGMTAFLKSLIDKRMYIIRCPGKTPNNKDCNK